MMNQTAKKVVKISENIEYWRLAFDGLFDTNSDSQQFVSVLATFSSKKQEFITEIRDIYCGINFEGDSGNVATLQLNVYKGLDPVLGDAETPDYPQSFPVGFNATGSNAEYAKLNQIPIIFAGANETAELSMRILAGQSIPPFSLQFTKEIKPVIGQS